MSCSFLLLTLTCPRACIAAMDCIKAGQHATRAVQAAIKVMEDTEFTNAGIGSNLSERGIVEGDANIVDERGLSGACGAVPGKLCPDSAYLLTWSTAHVP